MVNVLDLKPTQFALGYYEIDIKIDKLKKMKPQELEKYLTDKRVPVIIGPNENLYMIDRHHLTRCCWELKIEKVCVNVISDLSHLPPDEFWEVMKRAKWCHLIDQFGQGPHSYELLPENVRSMGNDPYRSIAWLLKENKIYLKNGNKVPFIEFYWADYLRKRIKYQHGHEGIKQMLKESLILVKSDKEALNLPGFRME